MADLRSNVWVVEGDFHPGAVFTVDGALFVFRREFSGERINDGMLEIDMSEDVTSLVVTQKASDGFPLPLGLIGGLIRALIKVARGRHLSYATIVTSSGESLKISTEPATLQRMVRAAGP